MCGYYAKSKLKIKIVLMGCGLTLVSGSIARALPYLPADTSIVAQAKKLPSNRKTPIAGKPRTRPALNVEWVTAQIVSEAAIVYVRPDFDADMFGEIEGGRVVQLSKQKFAGAFYMIKLPKGKVGYVADSDTSVFLKERAKKAIETQRKPFALANYRGLSYNLIRFREDTMSLRPTEQLNMLGLKFSGPGVMLDGIPMEVDLMFYNDAPNYYEKATGRGASGFLFMGDFILTTPSSFGKSAYSYTGFGPMFKYSRFDVTLANTNYSLEDMQLGVIFNVGLAFRMGSFSFRSEVRYYWERLTYFAWINGIGMEF